MVMRYAEQPCPHCGAKLDATAGFEDDIEPRVGDVAICAACHGFLVWAYKQPEPGKELDESDLTQVKLTAREFNDLPGDVRADLLRAQAHLEEIKKQEALKGAKH